ncbi:hypothetical protein LXL04_028212 [Taraxacum kok-saghyz]
MKDKRISLIRICQNPSLHASNELNISCKTHAILQIIRGSFVDLFFRYTPLQIRSLNFSQKKGFCEIVHGKRFRRATSAVAAKTFRKNNQRTHHCIASAVISIDASSSSLGRGRHLTVSVRPHSPATSSSSVIATSAIISVPTGYICLGEEGRDGPVHRSIK